MSKIKMLLDVVQDMRRLTDSLETLAHAIEGPEGTRGIQEDQTAASEKLAEIKQPTTAQGQPTVQGQSAEDKQSAERMPSAPVAATSAPDAPKPPTLVELRAFVAERSTPQTRPQIRALLARHGVAKLTDLPESAYLDLMREVEAL